jgi:hypothetical protein
MNMPKLKVSVGLGFANARQCDDIEIDDEEWNACETEADRQKLIDQYAMDWAWNYIDLAAEVVE